MVELAQAKGWARLNVRGTKEFKRAVWLEASLRGLELRGFDPAPVDLQRLAETRQERERRQVLQEQAFEHRTHTAREAAQPKAAKVPADEAALTPNQSTAIQALRAVLQERGDSPEQVSAAVEVAEERFSRRRAYIGTVLDHGAAPYDFNDDNERSHFVRLRTAQGERVVWGVDLARAISDGDIAVGDEIALAFQGRQPVTVKVKQRDQQGHVVGVTEITTNRNRWAAEKVESLRAEALAAIRRGPSNTTRQPRVCTYDTAAPSRTQPPKPPERDQSRPVQRSR
jgi:putative DNA primase/helicase